MKVLLQRVVSASVTVDGQQIARIDHGLLLLVGAARGDTTDAARALAGKVSGLRVFADDAGRFDRSLLDTQGEALVVSQFTLLGDTRKGRRPSFTEAEAPERARTLVEEFGAALEQRGVRVSRGRFGAHMLVDLVNDGPVTLLLEG
ncbi:MAG: D-tyrosyl-tRNA(Tyr) deacylase [Chloroflexia bacterium]|nr:D-tyrosyl-tRNA(Tyr) deacylase [Chloroflexia bacterium]